MYSQASSKINNAQNVTIIDRDPSNLTTSEELPLGTWKKVLKDSIKWETYNINGLKGYIQGLAYPLTGNPSGFLTSFTEIDPTVPSYSKGLTGFSVIKLSTDLLYYPLIGNPSGYLTSVPPQSWASITGKPTFAVVASTGDYNDLVNKPSIPSAQVNSDWNSTSGVSQILNKPIVYSFTGLNTQYTRGDGTYAIFPTTVSSFINDSNYITSTSLTGTLSNYVTTTSLTSTLGNYATTTSLSSGLAGKENSITAGTITQYWRGDKTWQTLNTSIVTEGTNLYYTDTRARLSNSAGTGISYNSSTGVITNSAPDQTVAIIGTGNITVTGSYPSFTVSSPVVKRQETYTGTTNASGNYVVTFSTPYSVAPNIQVNIANQGSSTNQFVKVVSASTTGFTVNVFQRNSVTLLSVEVLLAATVNVSGATVDVLVTEK